MKTARFLLLLFILGGLSTGLWLGTMQFPTFRGYLFSLQTLTGLAVCVLLTTFNLLARWFRWHFLVRRFTRHIGTRDSLLVYFATLPAIITPFCIGELLRVFLLRKGAPGAVRRLGWVWVIERVIDSAALLSFYLITKVGTYGMAGVPVVAVGCYFLLRVVLLKQSQNSTPMLTVGVLAITAAAWILPITALFITLNLFVPAEFNDAARAFSASTLIGGITGLPAGVFVTGSEMIRELTSDGTPSDAAILSILIFRVGTAWYAVFLGVAIYIFRKKRLREIVQNIPDQHFDTIASEYTNEIPEHVRSQLLNKKVDFIRSRLNQHKIPPGSLGLDVGCGHGWYLAEFVRAGYAMCGVDYSSGQLVEGRTHLRRENLEAVLVQGDAQSLPFPDNSFDYAYSINAIHHILSPEAQARSLSEIVRVLRPGGVFLLNEMNTMNFIFLFYMSYLFPLIRRIDQGDELWILPTALPSVPGGKWFATVDYFTFIPDFLPQFLHRFLRPIEQFLEKSRLGRYSAHYQAILIKEETGKNLKY